MHSSYASLLCIETTSNERYTLSLYFFVLIVISIMITSKRIVPNVKTKFGTSLLLTINVEIRVKVMGFFVINYFLCGHHIVNVKKILLGYQMENVYHLLILAVALCIPLLKVLFFVYKKEI